MTKLLIKKQALKATKPIEIIPNLYIGNLANALSLNKNDEPETNNKFGLVISCIKIDERDRCKNVEYHFVPVKDKPQ